MANGGSATESASRAHWRIQLTGYLIFFGLMAMLALLLVRGYAEFGDPWMLALLAIAAYLAADLLSGIVRFLADNFGSPETPFIGPGFVLPFRQHHDRHHRHPHNAHYCITVGVWNPIFERWQIFDRLERLIRRWVPGTDPRRRVEQEMAEVRMVASRSRDS